MQPASNSRCPRCSEPIRASDRSGLLMCTVCGYIPGITTETAGENSTAESVSAATERSALPIRHTLIYRDALSQRALSLFESGVSALERGQVADAIDSFQDALGVEPNFIDAHICLARLLDNPHTKRDHLSAVIAYDPANLEALRLLMILNGQLTPDEAERAQGDHSPVVRKANTAINTDTQALLCSVCGGHLSVDEVTGKVTCRFCGHEPPVKQGSNQQQVLGVALIQRKAQPERWITDEHRLRCRQCGVERIIPATALSVNCPFCGSNHVIEQDALKTFVRPDGVIPFVLTEKDVIQAIKQALDAPSEKFAGLFDDKRVKRGIIEGVFVPFWLFDVTVLISRFVQQRESSVLLRQRGAAYIPPTEERFTDGIFNLSIPAIRSILNEQVRKITAYRFEALTAYDPKLLARYPASLYDIDFDATSLMARGTASQWMRDKHGGTDYDGDKTISLSTSVQSMMFSLVLLPMFTATLTERDGDSRLAWINGQTGAVTLGQSRKITS